MAARQLDLLVFVLIFLSTSVRGTWYVDVVRGSDVNFNSHDSW